MLGDGDGSGEQFRVREWEQILPKEPRPSRRRTADHSWREEDEGSGSRAKTPARTLLLLPPLAMRLTTAHRALRLSRSLTTSTTYSPPLHPGLLPAYDQALLFLAADKSSKLEQLARMEKAGEAKETLEKAEVEAWVNDPETRWRAEKGLGEWGWVARLRDAWWVQGFGWR